MGSLRWTRDDLRTENCDLVANIHWIVDIPQTMQDCELKCCEKRECHGNGVVSADYEGIERW